MKYLLTIIVAISALMPLKSLATTRDPIVGESDVCYAQFDVSKKRVLGIKSLKIVELGASKYPSSIVGKPEQYTHAYEFVLQGYGGLNLLASPALMNSIATEILTRCQSIGSVVFAINQTDQAEIFGKQQNGSVAKFSCTPDVRKIAWGTRPCP